MEVKGNEGGGFLRGEVAADKRCGGEDATERTATEGLRGGGEECGGWGG